MKFQAPQHVTSIFTGGLEIRADEDGVAELPEGAEHVVQTMIAHGWTPLAEEAAKSAGKPAGKPAGAQSDAQPPADA